MAAALARRRCRHRCRDGARGGRAPVRRLGAGAAGQRRRNDQAAAHRVRGLALAPVNNAALADAPEEAHGTASALVVVARMVGMVVGLAVLTAIGLHRYYQQVAALPDPTDVDALIDAAITQVQTMLLGASVAAALAAIACLA